MSGFAHAPTEGLIQQALALAGVAEVITVKGLEGGVDLPISRVAIAAHHREGRSERLILKARDHGLRSADLDLESLALWREQALAALRCEGPLLEALLWNGAIQLWRLGLASDLGAGLAAAERLLRDGAVEQKRQAIRATLEEGAGREAQSGLR
ncbi:MAG: hypothetical protein ACKO6E_10050 [Planctomycetota bacterium]